MLPLILTLDIPFIFSLKLLLSTFMRHTLYWEIRSLRFDGWDMKQLQWIQVREKGKGQYSRSHQPCLTFNFTHNLVRYAYIWCDTSYRKAKSSGSKYVHEKIYRRTLHYSDLISLKYSVIFSPHNQYGNLIMTSGTLLKRVTWVDNKVTTVRKVGSGLPRQPSTYSHVTIIFQKLKTTVLRFHKFSES